MESVKLYLDQDAQCQALGISIIKTGRDIIPIHELHFYNSTSHGLVTGLAFFLLVSRFGQEGNCLVACAQPWPVVMY